MPSAALLANISVGHDSNINILEAFQMFSASWKMFSAVTVVICFQKYGIFFKIIYVVGDFKCQCLNLNRGVTILTQYLHEDVTFLLVLTIHLLSAVELQAESTVHC
jgi:hypothetical protein